jgi:hypothetical protein
VVPAPLWLMLFLIFGVIVTYMLFFAEISTKLQTPLLRSSVLVLGSLLLVVTVAWIATFPVSVSI